MEVDDETFTKRRACQLYPTTERQARLQRGSFHRTSVAQIDQPLTGMFALVLSDHEDQR